ncbi:MAG: hypothetical protein WKF87_08985 [Chryseolinea sp.]
MKINQLRNLHFLKMTCAVCSLALAGLLSGCDDDDDPKKEDTPELITKVTLTFTPAAGGAAVTVTATDPDGEGVQDLQVDGPINLAVNKSYTLTINLINGLASPSSAGYDITAEVKEEGSEHMFFFGWTNNVFSDPTGDGNIDARNDDVNYADEDENGLPLGLETTWTAAAAPTSGTFQVVLKHQPDIKSAISSSSTGETDLDIEFSINVQ